MYIENNNSVYRQEVSEDKRFINTSYIGPFRKAVFESPQKSLTAGETLIIAISWMKFNLSAGEYIPDENYKMDYNIQIDTQQGDSYLKAVTPYGEPFEFSADVPDVYYLQASCGNAGSDILEINVIPVNEEIDMNQKFTQLQHQNLIILDALADLLAEYPLPEGRKAEVDIYAELIEAGRRELKDVPEALKEAVGKELKIESGNGDGGLAGRE